MSRPRSRTAARVGARLVSTTPARHDRAERDGGAIEGATLIPVQELPARINDVTSLAGGDKSKPIVIYCASGRRAGKAKEMLAANGFTNVVNAGGYSDLK